MIRRAITVSAWLLAGTLLYFAAAMLLLPTIERTQLEQVSSDFFASALHREIEVIRSTTGDYAVLFGDTELFMELESTIGGAASGDRPLLPDGQWEDDRSFFVSSLRDVWPDLTDQALGHMDFYRGEIASETGQVCSDDACDYYALVDESQAFVLIISD